MCKCKTSTHIVGPRLVLRGFSHTHKEKSSWYETRRIRVSSTQDHTWELHVTQATLYACLSKAASEFVYSYLGYSSLTTLCCTWRLQDFLLGEREMAYHNTTTTTHTTERAQGRYSPVTHLNEAICLCTSTELFPNKRPSPHRVDVAKYICWKHPVT